ncbi:hypothetical protein [Staphylococcus saprophyticus]|uniref:hypothetical protein n=1 Tax=Staphylococcus saprophyticus TaxID=29385 RepID=UPI0034C64FBB
MENQKMVLEYKEKKEILESIKNFLDVEFDTEYENVNELLKEAFKNEFLIPIAYTTFAECEDIEINVYFDLANTKLIKRAGRSNGLIYQEVEFYKDMHEAQLAVESYEFEKLPVFEKDTDWILNKLLD